MTHDPDEMGAVYARIQEQEMKELDRILQDDPDDNMEFHWSTQAVVFIGAALVVVAVWAGWV